MNKINFTITGVRFTDASSFIVTKRNSDNSRFYIRPKADYEREKELDKRYRRYGREAHVQSILEGVFPESAIIEMIDSGKEFYTINKGVFTPVTVVNGHLKSVPNGATLDNLESLPLL